MSYWKAIGLVAGLLTLGNFAIEGIVADFSHPAPAATCTDGSYQGVHRSWPTPNTNYRPPFLTPQPVATFGG